METDAFIEQLASEMGINRETIRKWRQRGIPHYRRDEIREAAERQSRIIRREDFEKFGSDRDAA